MRLLPFLLTSAFALSTAVLGQGHDQDGTQPADEPGRNLGQCRIEGTVRDVTGALLPGVTLTIEGGGASRTMATTRTGRYLFRDVSPGAYQLSASMEGFKTQQIRHVEVSEGYGLTIDLVLNLDDLHEPDGATPVEVVHPELVATLLPRTANAGQRWYRLGSLELRFRVPKTFDAFRRPPDKSLGDRYADYIVALEKTVVEDALLEGMQLEEVMYWEDAPAVHIGLVQGKSALVLRELFDSDDLREIGGRPVYNPPAAPGPYGGELFYYLIPIDQETMILEIVAPRLFENMRETFFNEVVEEIIRSLRD